MCTDVHTYFLLTQAFSGKFLAILFNSPQRERTVLSLKDRIATTEKKKRIATIEKKREMKPKTKKSRDLL